MSFRLQSVTTDRGIVPFWFSDTASEEQGVNICTVIIGKNGSGKSRLLADICRSFISLDTPVAESSRGDRFNPNRKHLAKPLDLFTLQYAVDNNVANIIFDKNRSFEQQEDAAPTKFMPARVIASTVTPFDKFPIGKRLIGKSGDDSEEDTPKLFRYLGSKNNIGQLSSIGQISRVIESMIIASTRDTPTKSRISKVFDFLGYVPRVVIKYELSVAKTLLSDLQNGSLRQESLLDRLTAGKEPSSRTQSLQRRMENSDHFADTLFSSLTSLASAVDPKRNIAIELDFDAEGLNAELVNLFKDIQFLRALGFIRFTDLELFKSETAISISDASSGEQGVVVTLLGIASEIEDNSLVIIDEPEIGLHPEWQERFIPLMSEIFASYKGCHFILATHSPQIIARTGVLRCAVLTMDDLSITDAKELYKRSADYQLAEMFDTPGYRNEYLAREALAALNLASKRSYETEAFKDRLDLLARVRPNLQEDDPVAQMADAVIQLAGRANQ